MVLAEISEHNFHTNRKYEDNNNSIASNALKNSS